MTGTIIAVVIGVILLIATGNYLINIYNKLIMLNKNIEKSFVNIDVLLKQRADEIPNLIKVVKQSMSYEQEMLNGLTALRTQYLNTDNINEKIKISNEITSALKTVFAVSENYPDLKAGTSLLNLQQRVSQLEDHIADRREFYNESVNMYNIGILEFPDVIFSKLMGYREKSLLEITVKEKEYDGIQF
ncbi:MAG: LemA family protein [Prevotellaceae bacterium]|jgi:LemA protein|nr:LemA family protein [Prevotellaceae bacterium]